MKRRSFAFGLLALAAACTDEAGNDSGRTRQPGTSSELPRPSTESGMTLAAALVARRSVREFAGTPLRADELSQLLWAAQGVSAVGGLRTAPSAGALYPLTAYAVGPSGSQRYLPDSGRVIQLLSEDLRAPLAQAAGQPWLAAAPVVLVITGHVGRTAGRYGARAERYVHLEAGHAAQNVLLQAVALGLGATPVGAFDDDEVGRLLQLPGNEQPLYLLPVGHPR